MIAFLVPYALWVMLPAWHTPLAILATVSLLAATLALGRRVRRAQVGRAALPSDTDWRWRPAWDSTQYGARLATFLRMSGWRIEPATLAGPDSIALIVRKDRLSASLLCRRPGQPVRDTDIAALRRLQQTQANDRAVLISDDRVPEDAGTAAQPILSLPYAALRRLDDHLIAMVIA